jgi:hypothetical protein
MRQYGEFEPQGIKETPSRGTGCVFVQLDSRRHALRQEKAGRSSLDKEHGTENL